MASTHSPTRNVSESPSTACGSGRGDDTLMSAMSVSGSDPIRSARRLRPSASRTAMRSAPFDHVVVRQDEPVRIDDEPGSCPAPRTLTLALGRAVQTRSGLSGKRHARSGTRPGTRCATSRRYSRQRDSVARRRRQTTRRPGPVVRQRRRAQRGEIRLGGRLCRSRRHGAGDDEPNQERDSGHEAHRHDQKSSRHSDHYIGLRALGLRAPGRVHGSGFWAISARKAASSSIGTPSVLALSALLPASSPTITAVVFLLTEPVDLGAKALEGGGRLLAGHRGERACDDVGPAGQRARAGDAGAARIRAPPYGRLRHEGARRAHGFAAHPANSGRTPPGRDRFRSWPEALRGKRLRGLPSIRTLAPGPAHRVPRCGGSPDRR